MLGRSALTNKLVAKELALDEKLVSSVMDFCYKEWDKEFNECNHTYLYIPNLGTFGINLAIVNRRLKYLIWKIRTEKNHPSEAKKRILDGMRREVFYLFDLRRRVRTLKNNNTQLRRDGKARRNSERKLVQAPGQESGSISQENGIM